MRTAGVMMMMKVTAVIIIIIISCEMFRPSCILKSLPTWPCHQWFLFSHYLSLIWLWKISCCGYKNEAKSRWTHATRTLWYADDALSSCPWWLDTCLGAYAYSDGHILGLTSVICVHLDFSLFCCSNTMFGLTSNYLTHLLKITIHSSHLLESFFQY